MQSYKEYSKIDLGNFKQIVEAIPSDKWTFRCDPESYETCVIRENDEAFPKKEIQQLLDNLPLKPGYTNRVVLSCVPAGKGILPHTDDFGEAVRNKSKHYHIPIITEESVILGFDDGECHLKEGFLYSMDETQTHYVKNPSSVDRVHLLFAHFPHDGIIGD